MGQVSASQAASAERTVPQPVVEQPPEMTADAAYSPALKSPIFLMNAANLQSLSKLQPPRMMTGKEPSGDVVNLTRTTRNPDTQTSCLLRLTNKRDESKTTGLPLVEVFLVQDLVEQLTVQVSEPFRWICNTGF